MSSMKINVILTLMGTCLFSSLVAQDGSNIRYFAPDELDDSLIGKFCHIDFGKVSFEGQVIDTIEINVKGQQMKFYEHREDNGYNNWFNKQYLIRVSDKKHSTTRLQNSRIDSLTTDEIYVTSILEYYHYESSIDTITIFQLSYNKNNISRVLIKD